MVSQTSKATKRKLCHAIFYLISEGREGKPQSRLKVVSYALVSLSRTRTAKSLQPCVEFDVGLASDIIQNHTIISYSRHQPARWDPHMVHHNGIHLSLQTIGRNDMAPRGG